MGTIVVLIGVLIIAIGFVILVKGMRINQAVQRYEFENRTDGGVVKFKDFDSSREHVRMQMRAKFVQGFAIFLLVVGAFIFAFGLMVH